MRNANCAKWHERGRVEREEMGHLSPALSPKGGEGDGIWGLAGCSHGSLGLDVGWGQPGEGRVWIEGRQPGIAMSTGVADSFRVVAVHGDGDAATGAELASAFARRSKQRSAPARR